MRPAASLSNRTVLVTGGAGFIGSHLAEALVEENDVRVLDDLSTGSREKVPDEATLIVGDVREQETVDQAMKGVDIVFHEAAVVSVEESIADPQRSHEINTSGTLAVLETAKREDARVVFASSAAVYGHPESVPIDESAPMMPTSPYGVQKQTADAYVRRYHELYGLETVSLRYFNVFGPGQTGSDYAGVIEVFRQQAENRGPITVDGDGTQTRDFIHVDDIVQANLRAATTGHTGEAYNIGTGESTSIRELATIVQEDTDEAVEIVHRDARPGDISESRANIRKAKKMLDFEPTVSITNGLQRMDNS